MGENTNGGAAARAGFQVSRAPRAAVLTPNNPLGSLCVGVLFERVDADDLVTDDDLVAFVQAPLSGNPFFVYDDAVSTSLVLNREIVAGFQNNSVNPGDTRIVENQVTVVPPADDELPLWRLNARISICDAISFHFSVGEVKGSSPVFCGSIDRISVVLLLVQITTFSNPTKIYYMVV